MAEKLTAAIWAKLCKRHTVWAMHYLRRELELRDGVNIEFVEDMTVIDDDRVRDFRYVQDINSTRATNASVSFEVYYHNVKREIKLREYPYMKDGEKKIIRCADDTRTNTFYVYRRLKKKTDESSAT